MGNIILINGSPKKINDSSGHLLKQTFDKIDGKRLVINVDIQGRKFSREEKLQIISEGSILVLASPIYMGTIPSSVCEFLEDIEDALKDKNTKEKKLYAIVNCGSIDGEEGSLGLEVIENFTKRTESITYAGGIGIGGIGFFGIKDKGIYIEKNIEDVKLEWLIDKINKGESLEENIYSRLTDKKFKDRKKKMSILNIFRLRECLRYKRYKCKMKYTNKFN
ncbi:MAG: hypothetical protein ACRC28_05025 [Clostridium sp.]|uniref:hypothetical protein n=1 Tax=Clostridium sp. TaxID=1506 RepID=UPI003F3348CB